MKKIRVILPLLISLFLGGLSSGTVFATTWPQQAPVAPGQMEVSSPDKLSMLDCSTSYEEGHYNTAAQAFLLDGTAKLSSTKSGLSQNQYLPSLQRCATDAMVSTAGGVLYGSAYKGNTTPSNTIFAEKDGHFAWEISVKVCQGMANEYGYAYAMEMGSDGLLYAVLTSSAGYSNCPNEFVVINPANGTIELSMSLSTGTGGSVGPSVSTYSSGVVVTDKNGYIYYFDNGGSLTSTNSTALVNKIINKTWADANKRIYFETSQMNCVDHEVRYIDQGSTTDNLAFDLPDQQCGSYARLVPLPGASMAVQESSTTTSSVTKYTSAGSVNLVDSVPAGNAEYPIRIDGDTNGNVTMVSQRYNTSTHKSNMVVRLFNFSNNSVSTIWDAYTAIPSQDDDQTSYNVGAAYGNDLYLPMCSGACYPNTQAASKIYKIALTGFSSVYKSSGAFGTGAVDADGDGLTASQEAAQNTSDSNVDTDGDGLSDLIESQWYPGRQSVFCGTNCAYPNPTSKDLFVEVDWMKDGSHVMKPSQTQLDSVASAYSNKGITAHFDTGQYGGGNELPSYIQDLYFAQNSGQFDFYDFKNGTSSTSPNFNANRKGIWHYMVSGYEFHDITGSSGVSYVGDDDSFISFGFIEADPGNKFNYNTLDEAISGTILHELGHTMCLSNDTRYASQAANCIYANIDTGDPTTGGVDDYVSVMNYEYQMFMVDYSNGANSSPNDHDDWTSILGGGIADFSETDRNFGDVAGVSDKDKKVKKVVRGITQAEAKALKKAGKLGGKYKRN